jgi:hypothetical protein
MDIAEMVRQLMAMRFNSPAANPGWGIDESGIKAPGAGDVRGRMGADPTPWWGRSPNTKLKGFSR